MHTERQRARRYPFVLAFRCDKKAGVPGMIQNADWEQDTGVVMPVASADQCTSRNVARFRCEMLRSEYELTVELRRDDGVGRDPCLASIHMLQFGESGEQ